MFPWPPPTVAIDIRLLIRALLAFGAGRVAPGQGHLASAYAVEHAGAIPGGQDIGAKNIMRTAAHAVRSVVGTNGVSDRLRRIEVGVEELRQRKSPRPEE